MMEKLQISLTKLESVWHSPRAGAKEATFRSIERLKNGQTIVFAYPFANPEVVDKIMHEAQAVGQFDLPLYRSDAFLHVKAQKKERPAQ